MEQKRKLIFPKHEYVDSNNDILNVYDFAKKMDKIGTQPKNEKNEILGKEASSALVYRGQSNGAWPLIPAIGRFQRYDGTHILDLDDEARRNLEADLLNRFLRYAYPFLQREPSPWETLTIAQHHGLPTRLLDWTFNPLVALWFASRRHFPSSNDPNDKGSDGAIYWFRPRRKWTYHVSIFERSFREGHRHEENPLKVRGVKIMYSMGSSQRLLAQAGCFTIQDPFCSLEEQANYDFNDDEIDIYEMHKYKVPRDAKKDILDQLERMNINIRTLFPELASVGEGVAESEKFRQMGEKTVRKQETTGK